VRQTAVVTGATAGIGAAFARVLAAEGYGLLLVARDEERLAKLAAELPTPATYLRADLATDEGCDAVAAELVREPPDLLVNNAGMSLNTHFLRSSVAQEEMLLRLNVHSVMRLSLAALPPMVARRRGDVINVSSVAGFGTLAPGSTYPASKAWVTNFTVSTAEAVRRHGVRMMALCPGYVRTEFHERAGIDMSKTPQFLWLDAERVVRDALRDLRRGKMVSVPDWKYKMVVLGVRHVPGPLLRRIARGTRGRIGRDQET
jgi:uncharacterized protein